MAKIRSIHPDACDSDKLAELSDGAERTLWRLITHADDYGRGVDNPRLLANKLYPLRNDKTADVIDGHLDELVHVGSLVRYEVGGKRYYEVHDFEDWQKPKYKADSKLPSPDEGNITPTPEAIEPPSGEHRDQTEGTSRECVPDGELGEGRGRVSGEAPPGGNGEPFVKRLASELRQEHGCTFQSRDNLHDAYADLLSEALARLPEDRRQNTAMGVIADFVQAAQGLSMTKEARSHTARLVNTHDPVEVLHGFGEALAWGAGIGAKYADDPLSLSKYVAGVLSKRGKGAA